VQQNASTTISESNSNNENKFVFKTKLKSIIYVNGSTNESLKK
jgi:hypothetical protein